MKKTDDLQEGFQDGRSFFPENKCKLNASPTFSNKTDTKRLE